MMKCMDQNNTKARVGPNYDVEIKMHIEVSFFLETSKKWLLQSTIYRGEPFEHELALPF